ncbi:hypothetical protein HRS9139_04761 [Pyrenophora teres f. teres]|nr:hypothetical protein HRS9139_04761 [Pyrenophora teres f. teres]
MLRTQDSHLPLPLAQARLVDENSYIPPPPSYRASVHHQPSLDLPQRIEQKLAQYDASQNICKRWLFEIASVTTSAVCMGAIIGLLHYLSDKPLNKWPLGLVFITVLSKIASAALILPISEAIGQLKWIWFHGKNSRDAFDFEIFDKASRGAWGSLMLLCRTKGRSLAALGALLTVLLLAIDTFFQQVTDLPERLTLHGDSFIPHVIRYEPVADVVEQYETGLGDVAAALVNNDMKTALEPFFYDQNGTRPLKTGNATQPEIPLACPTGTCEWPPYKTLGFCSACEDVSYLLEYACLNMRMDWIRSSTGPTTKNTYPNGTACGYFLNATSQNPVLMSGFRVDNRTDPSPGETLLMLDGTVDSVYKKKAPVAQECMLTWCVKTLRSSYTSGDYQEQVVETFVNTTRAEWPWWTRDYPELQMTDTEFRANISLSPPSMESEPTSFGAFNTTVLNIVVIFDNIFPSSLTVSNATAPPFFKIKTAAPDEVFFRAVRFNPWLAPNNVTHHMERMARAMTNAIRSDSSTNKLVAGTAYLRETYVAVRWEWLTFPLVMLLLSIGFLVATMIKTSHQKYNDIGTWKSSAIPSLMYGLPKDMQRDFVVSTTSRRTFSRRSKKVRIRLQPKQGWRVSGHAQAGPVAPPGFI